MNNEQPTTAEIRPLVLHQVLYWVNSTVAIGPCVKLNEMGIWEMNERIEKLGEQADLLGECTPTKIPGRYVGYITEEQILKFAELIVRECAKALDDKLANPNGASMAWCDGSDLLEHFGVEE